MRDIRFRAKRKDNGEWTYGYVDATMYKDIVVIHTDYSTHGVDPETVGQSSGLEDKDGKKIYEGDIVEVTSPHEQKLILEVVFSESHAAFMVNKGTRFMPYYPLCRTLEENSVVVIGNIHDNPEWHD